MIVMEKTLQNILTCDSEFVLNNKLCKYKSCKYIASYNTPGSTKPLYCSKHKLASMVTIGLKKCEFKDCGKGASFGHTKYTFCSAHKQDGMKNLKHKVCNFTACIYQATWGITKAEYCATHKKDLMIDFKHRKRECEIEDCKRSATFGLSGQTATRCSTHKTNEMINKHIKICEYTGCSKTASFNTIGESKALFCFSHKETNMKNVVSQKCLEDGCDVIGPAFGIKGSAPQFCETHKKPGMLNIKSKKCEHAGCESVSRQYDFEKGKGMYCTKHKLDGMVDVKSRLCSFKDCKIHASYGKPGQSRTHCATHREIGMLKRPNLSCMECKDPAIWGTVRELKHCELHKLEGELNLAERNCKSCGFLYILDNDNNCENCNLHTFFKVALAKQTSLTNYLDSRDLLGLTTDKIIDGGVCGKERPDRIYDFSDKIVILECDENQHKDREETCEITRMKNIGQMFGGMPVYFIRWNPDTYKPEIPGIGLESIKDRHKLVADYLINIKESRICLPTALVAVIYMYYDGWSFLHKEEWKIITNYHTP